MLCYFFTLEGDGESFCSCYLSAATAAGTYSFMYMYLKECREHLSEVVAVHHRYYFPFALRRQTDFFLGTFYYSCVKST